MKQPNAGDHAARELWCCASCFYVGSGCPADPIPAYKEHQARSYLFKIGSIDAAGSVFVLTPRAVEAAQPGLYSTGRILRSMAINGSGPNFAAMSNRAVRRDLAHRRYRIGIILPAYQTEPQAFRSCSIADGSPRPGRDSTVGERRGAAAAEIRRFLFSGYLTRHWPAC